MSSQQTHTFSMPPQVTILNLIHNLLSTKVVMCLTRLAIPDALVDGHQTAQAVADKLQLNADGTYRLLRAAAAVGVIDRHADDTFSLNPVGNYLVSTAPGYVKK